MEEEMEWKCRQWVSGVEHRATYFHALEKEMATHSSVLAWRIPWTEEPGRLQSIGLHSWTPLKQLSTYTKYM
jgi:hypothetical protein